MKTKINFKKVLSSVTLTSFLVTTLTPATTLAASNDKIIYPLKEVSKLECRFNDFDDLSSSCKMDLPVLKTKDYEKYATQN